MSMNGIIQWSMQWRDSTMMDEPRRTIIYRLRPMRNESYFPRETEVWRGRRLSISGRLSQLRASEQSWSTSGALLESLDSGIFQVDCPSLEHRNSSGALLERLESGLAQMAYQYTDDDRAMVRKVEKLEAIRREGNRMFAERNWTGAIGSYSHCINLAGGPAYFEHEKSGDDRFDFIAKLAFNTVLALANSDRAEARLRLQDYEGALDDAKRALNIDPCRKHIKSLVRKGKALHGLEYYDKACQAYKCALAESPEERWILKLLKESTTADEQSRTGRYDLKEYFCRGCMGKVPCADFVGPVEIRRAPCGDGGQRGLFATQNLEPGELLLVSNPLVARRQKMKRNPKEKGMGGGFEMLRYEFPEKLLSELVDRIRKSRLQLVRFMCLASDDVPQMQLFRPGSVWIPPDPVIEIREEYIGEIARNKMFYYVEDSSNSAMFHYGDSTEVAGLWILPAFANHSCAPNCQHSFVGDTMFFRASRQIVEGEELTIPYDSDIYADPASRQESLQKGWFTCKCARCVFEEELAPQLSKISKAADGIRWLDRQTAMLTNADRYGGETDIAADEAMHDIEAEPTNAADEVEAVIQSLGSRALARQQAWIRATFIPLYYARLFHPDDYLANFKLVMDSQKSVYITPSVLEMAARLLVLMEQHYSKDSRAYQDTLDQVRDIYRVYFGRHPDAVLYKLIKANSPNVEMVSLAHCS